MDTVCVHVCEYKTPINNDHLDVSMTFWDYKTLKSRIFIKQFLKKKQSSSLHCHEMTLDLIQFNLFI